MQLDIPCFYRPELTLLIFVRMIGSVVHTIHTNNIFSVPFQLHFFIHESKQEILRQKIKFFLALCFV
jgi:hypothetical protein